MIPARALPVRLLVLLAAGLGLGGVLGATRAGAQDAGPAAAPAPAPAGPAQPAPAEPACAPGDADAARLVHAFHRMAPGLLRGASPETEADFAALAKAGVKSIVSVDGAKPDVETAKKHGIRYVHIPFGYDGIPPEKLLELVKTYQILAGEGGAIFVHCHHGKHRGPAAAAIGLCVLEGGTPEQGVADMRLAGTDPRYKGLYDSVREFRMPSAEELKAVKADLPSVAAVPALAAVMVDVDGIWERMKLVKAASWAPPADHPDVDPPHEATILAEHFRELARRPEVAREPEAFRKHLSDSEDAAWALARALAKGKTDPNAAGAAFGRVAATCAACHTTFRDQDRHRHGAGAAPGR